MPDPKKKTKKRQDDEATLKELVRARNQSGGIPAHEEIGVEILPDDPTFDNEQDFYDYYVGQVYDYADPRYKKMVELGEMTPLEAVRISPRIRNFPSFEYYQEMLQDREGPLGSNNRPDMYAGSPAGLRKGNAKFARQSRGGIK